MSATYRNALLLPEHSRSLAAMAYEEGLMPRKPSTIFAGSKLLPRDKEPVQSGPGATSVPNGSAVSNESEESELAIFGV